MDFHLPKKGSEKAELLKKMDKFKNQDVDWKRGKIFSMVYYLDDEYYEFLIEAHNKFFSENGLNVMAFKSLKNFEHECIRMTINLFQGGMDCVGVMTTGGTESILMAVKTYRDMARKNKPWISKPEMVVPDTIHVAFDKAAKYFDVKIVRVPIDENFKVDVAKLKKAVNRNTIMIAASAPQYPHGVVDPIADIGHFASKKGIPFHVDACIGGFILPFIEMLGQYVPKWDFRVEGVTSISSDFHKYGYSSKGASALVYKNMNYMKHQFFIAESWPGGIYASPSFPGTKSGAAVAAAWAAMMALGIDGYMKQTKRILDTRHKFIDAVKSIPELEIMGTPESSIVTFKSREPKKFNIYLVADYLETKGWKIDRQQRPECIHHTLSPHHDQYIEQYFTDLREAVTYVKNHPELEPTSNAAMYGMMAKIPFRGMISKAILDAMENMYAAEPKMPDDKKEEPQTVMDVVQKVGLQAMDVKAKLDSVIESVKNKF